MDRRRVRRLEKQLRSLEMECGCEDHCRKCNREVRARRITLEKALLNAKQGEMYLNGEGDDW